jgi:hypothetical protein
MNIGVRGFPGDCKVFMVIKPAMKLRHQAAALACEAGHVE